MDDPVILLTNDDGIDSPGLGALYDALSEIGDVTAVAPADDHSAVGRSIEQSASVVEHELGYAVDGPPASCVVGGLEALVPEADLVVSGCNQGANLGAYVLGRSGTVSAAIEAAFFGVPAIAVSQYIAASGDVTWDDHDRDREAYAAAADATKYLVERALEADVFDRCDLLNVNVPDVETEVRGMQVTEPSHVYDMDATHENGSVRLNDRIWERMAAGDIPDPEGTDRRAIVDGYVSVSPLAAPHTTNHHEVLEGITADYRP